MLLILITRGFWPISHALAIFTNHRRTNKIKSILKFRYIWILTLRCIIFTLELNYHCNFIFWILKISAYITQTLICQQKHHSNFTLLAKTPLLIYFIHLRLGLFILTLISFWLYPWTLKTSAYPLWTLICSQKHLLCVIKAHVV